FFGGLAVMLYFLAIQHIDVGVATLLNYTAPIWSGLFSMLFIGERFSARVLIPLPIALLGIVLVVHAHASPGDVLGFGRWEIVGACSAIASGFAVTAGVISPLAVLVSMALGSLFLGDRITLFAAIGAALTIGGVAGVTYVTSLAAPRAAAAVEVVPEA